MTKPIIIEEKVLSLREVKDELKHVKRDNPNFRVVKVNDYLNHFVKLSSKENKELKSKIADLNIPRLKEEHICKIVDFLPSTPENIKIVLQQFPITISKENMNKIISVVKDYIKEDKK